MDKCFNVEYDVVLSFAGEDRKFVENTAKALRKKGIKVFYDKYEEVGLWGKDLYQHLDNVYQNKAKYAVIFISEHYRNKMWTNHELRSAQARAFTENEDYILPARFDDTEIPGIRKTTGYVDLQLLTPLQFAKKIIAKLGDIEPIEFIPEKISFVEDVLNAIYDDLSYEEIHDAVYDVFSRLTKTTEQERLLLATLVGCTCTHDLADSLHQDITLIERLSNLSRKEVIAILNGLSNLGFEYEIIKSTHGEQDKGNERLYENLHLRLMPPLKDPTFENATLILTLMYYGAARGACDSCASKLHMRLDFSKLTSRPSDEEIEAILTCIPDDEDQEEPEN